jgi:hypothetical protein
MTSIRTAEGFTIQELRFKFGNDVAKQIEVKIKDLMVTNYFQENDGNQIVLSPLVKLY